VPRLREGRLRRFLTQTPLAERAGAAVSTSSALAPGSHTAAPATAQESAEVLGVEPRGLTEAPTG
jgi:transcriptional regulator with XRE-family HTH domain